VTTFGVPGRLPTRGLTLHWGAIIGFEMKVTLPIIGLLFAGPIGSSAALAVSVTSGTVNGLAADIWTWTDASGNPRTVALKQEGNGNPGHGGYAVQFTYFVSGSKITINAESGNDGGFGYFVSHERYRDFADGAVDTIASHIFNTDDSPLGLDFPAVTTMPKTPPGPGAERFVIQYGHYGTIFADPVNPQTGGDSIPLPEGASNYAFYPLPTSTTWVFQDGLDYPRIDVSVSVAGVVAPGGNAPEADLASFDMRGPYGVMVFDNGIDGTVKTVLWGDQEYQFKPTTTPVVRDSKWTWQALNQGARYQALLASGFEMGLFEPAKVAQSATVDGYSAERGYTTKTFKAGGGVSYSSCPGDPVQVLPSDGEWPYQSVQYSLPCGAGQFKTPTTGKKIAWGTTSYYGTSLTAVYNGQKSFPFNGFPANNTLAYSVCLVTGEPQGVVSLTQAAANGFKKAKPKSDCATTAVP
jgi:hypothetical protein